MTPCSSGPVPAGPLWPILWFSNHAEIAAGDFLAFLRTSHVDAACACPRKAFFTGGLFFDSFASRKSLDILPVGLRIPIVVSRDADAALLSRAFLVVNGFA